MLYSLRVEITMSVLKPSNTYLIQVDSTRKNYTPSNFSNIPGEPIFAEDVLLHNRFVLDEESIKINQDFLKLKNNDYIIVYCNSLVPHSPNQIKFIYSIISKIGNKVILKIKKKLLRGYKLDHILSLVDEGKLSENMKYCGKPGFKIIQVEFSDLELLINYDPIIRSYHSTSWKT